MRKYNPMKMIILDILMRSYNVFCMFFFFRKSLEGFAASLSFDVVVSIPSYDTRI